MLTSPHSPRNEVKLIELEDIDAVERARAQRRVFVDVVGAAALLVACLHVHGAAPILRSFRGLERTLFPLRFPVLAVHFLDGAVEVLDIYRALVIVEGDDLEQLAAAHAIPVTDTGLSSRHVYLPDNPMRVSDRTCVVNA